MLFPLPTQDRRDRQGEARHPLEASRIHAIGRVEGILLELDIFLVFDEPQRREAGLTERDLIRVPPRRSSAS